jgi:hypothetical protein
LTGKAGIPINPSVAVIGLLFGRGPAAVPGFVVAVIVNAIQGVLRGRLRSHVGQECLKGVEPAIADLNAAVDVAMRAVGVRVAASSFHGLPSAVFRGFEFPLGVSVPEVGGGNCSPENAPAASGSSVLDVLGPNRGFVSAVADAVPSRSLGSHAGKTCHGEAAKLLSGEVLKSPVSRNRTNLSHAHSPKAGWAKVAGRFSPRSVTCILSKAVVDG